MPEYAVVRDTRLVGTMPGAFASWWNDLNMISASGTIRLQTVFNEVNRLKREHGRLHSLFILCHGFAGSSTNLRMSADVGGQGLQLGRECVLHSNVAAWEQVKNTASNIVVYACAAANTEAGNEFTAEDGRYLMGALAIHTNSVVYAADRIQWYSSSNFNFGAWEGTLLRFDPSGVTPREVSRPPVEFSELATVF